MREKILEFLKKAVLEKDFLKLETPEEALGHYSTGVAFRLAKLRKQAPNIVAEEIIKKIQEIAPAGFFEKIEIAGGGFINFWLSENILYEELGEILKMGGKYGLAKPRNWQIQVEYVSANPTGPLTLANGRGGFLGDALSNVLEWTGNKVEREYYVNDTGNQIITLGKSILASSGLIKSEENFYKGSYISDWAKKNKTRAKKHKDDPLVLGQLAAHDFFDLIKKTLEKKAGIKFDRYTSEDKNIHKKGYLKKALKIFESKGKAYKKDGATWLKTTEFKDDKDRVIITSDGFPTYFLADAGHYLETKERGFDGKINVLGPDHHGYVSRIQAAAEILGVKNSKTIITQAVRLVREGKEVKISKRAGEFVTLEELLKEVSPDVARFFFLMHSPDSHMDFDLALAKERSQKNPVYYAQYAYVRAVNILKKTRGNLSGKNLESLNTTEDINLIRKLIQFAEVLEDVAGDYQVHRLTRYAVELARIFHHFYEKEKVIGEPKDVLSARRALVSASKIVFENLFKVLGISAPKKM